MTGLAISRSDCIVVTGANGFIGKNLTVRLAEAGFGNVIAVGRDTPSQVAASVLGQADVVFHLAGANRPQDAAEYQLVNTDLTSRICEYIAAGARKPLFVHASSIKAGQPGLYGESKAQGEKVVQANAATTGFVAAIYRLPNVFGKWAQPNYNSAIATFCHNIARGADIQVHDRESRMALVYIDDLIDDWLELLAHPPQQSAYYDPRIVYSASLGEVADIITGFAEDRCQAMISSVGNGLIRALYATYVAALPTSSFAYELVAHNDFRGSFAEVLKTRTSGQFSFFTAHPGVTRGGHYHHTKTEKFVVVAGEALFRFRHILTGATHEVRTSSSKPVVVETIPGWAHDISNIGETELVCLLWANEIFNRERPDTMAATI